MKKNKGRLALIIISLLLNVILIFSIFQIGWNKTDYLRKIAAKYGIIELPQQEKADHWALLAWTNTLEKMNDTVDVAFFGNSITFGSNFQQYFTDISICNLGYPGDNLSGMIERVEMGQVNAVHPKKVFVMGGINGLENQSIATFKRQYLRLIDILHDSLPSASIYLESMLPINPGIGNGSLYAPNDKILEANKVIKDIADSLSFTYIDLFPLYAENGMLNPAYTEDGIHITSSNYAQWAETIRPLVYEIK